MKNIPTLSIAFMGVAMLCSILMFIFLLVFYRKKTKSRYSVFFIGCATFIVFALVLESIMHNIVLGKIPAIMDNMWLYALYGGLAAGVFEETGRYVAFRTVMRKSADKRDALMYGAGHGGIEVLLVLFMGMISNLVVSLLINGGMTDVLLASMPDEATAAQFTEQCAALADIAPYTFLLGIFERISAVMFHVSASVLVYYAAKNAKKRWLYPVAILLHAAFDAVAVIVSRLGMNAILVEIMLFVTSLAITLVSARVYRNMKLDTAEAPAEVIAQ